MAFRVKGGDDRPPLHPHDIYPTPSHKRRIDDLINYADFPPSPWVPAAPEPKRLRAENFACELPFLALQPAPPIPEPEPELGQPEREFEFVVLKENGIAVPPRPTPTPTPSPPVMERTASGHSIRPDPTTDRCAATELLEDDEAAQRVREHMATFKRRFPDSKHERILRSIINPRRRLVPAARCWGGGGPLEGAMVEDETQCYPLDNEALESIFSAANEIFFNGRLSQRVTWDWSHESSARYDAKVIGTTALRLSRAATVVAAGESLPHGQHHHHPHSQSHPHQHQHHHHNRGSSWPPRRGFETLIVLSAPILHDPRYSRRLLLSTFLHELIHSYMFICCGFRARHCGGHTEGFKTIACLVDDWVGVDAGLHLSKMEADLNLFRIMPTVPSPSPSPSRSPGLDEEGDDDGRKWSHGIHPGPGQAQGRGQSQGHDYDYEYSSSATTTNIDNVYPCSGRLYPEKRLEAHSYHRDGPGTSLPPLLEGHGRGNLALPPPTARWGHRPVRPLLAPGDDPGSTIRYPY